MAYTYILKPDKDNLAWMDNQTSKKDAINFAIRLLRKQFGEDDLKKSLEKFVIDNKHVSDEIMKSAVTKEEVLETDSLKKHSSKEKDNKESPIENSIKPEKTNDNEESIKGFFGDRL